MTSFSASANRAPSRARSFDTARGLLRRGCGRLSPSATLAASSSADQWRGFGACPGLWRQPRLSFTTPTCVGGSLSTGGAHVYSVAPALSVQTASDLTPRYSMLSVKSPAAVANIALLRFNSDSSEDGPVSQGVSLDDANATVVRMLQEAGRRRSADSSVKRLDAAQRFRRKLR